MGVLNLKGGEDRTAIFGFSFSKKFHLLLVFKFFLVNRFSPTIKFGVMYQTMMT